MPVGDRVGRPVGAPELAEGVQVHGSVQTSLHCLLSHEAPKRSGACVSQQSVLYRDRERRKGGLPIRSPARTHATLTPPKKLVDLS